MKSEQRKLLVTSYSLSELNYNQFNQLRNPMLEMLHFAKLFYKL